MQNVRAYMAFSILVLIFCLCFLECTSEVSIFRPESLFVPKTLKTSGFKVPKTGIYVQSRNLWIDHCHRVITDDVDGCLDRNGFWDHYTARLGTRDSEESRVSCKAAAATFRHQMCDIPCNEAVYMTIWGSGTGSGSRWHTYLNAITRLLGTKTMVRLFDRIGPFPPFVSETCVDGDERCYFSRADHCPTRDLPGELSTSNKTNMAGYTFGSDIKTFPAEPRNSFNRSELWLQSQVLFYLLQPKRFVLEWVDEFWKINSTTRHTTGGTVIRDNPYLIMHVRWGDKCKWPGQKGYSEAKCVPFLKYMEQADAFRALNPQLKHIVLSTTSADAVDLTRQYTNWTFSWLKVDRQPDILDLTLPPNNTEPSPISNVQALLTEFILAAYADYAVVTPSSGWARAFLRWSRALRGYIIPNACLDDWTNDASILGLNASDVPEIRDEYRTRLGADRYCFAHRENCTALYS